MHLLDRHLGVDAARIDREAGAFGGEAALGFRKTLLMPDQVHEVGGVLAVVDRERRVEADLLGIFAQQAGADAVIGSRPAQRVRHHPGIVAHHLAGDALDPSRHLGRGAAGKRHQQDPPGVGTPDDQVGHPMGEGVGFARPGARDHQQRRRRQSARGAVLDGAALLGIERVEVGGCRLHRACPFMV